MGQAVLSDGSVFASFCPPLVDMNTLPKLWRREHDNKLKGSHVKKRNDHDQKHASMWPRGLKDSIRIDHAYRVS
jgi:hypothetical protein